MVEQGVQILLSNISASAVNNLSKTQISAGFAVNVFKFTRVWEVTDFGGHYSADGEKGRGGDKAEVEATLQISFGTVCFSCIAISNNIFL